MICGTEQVSGSTLVLQSRVQVQVSKGRPYIHVKDSLDAIDVTRPVHDIRGTSVKWVCSPLPSPEMLKAFGASSYGPPCARVETPHNEGKCYRTTFGDWRCFWADLSAPMSNDPRLKAQPPSASEAE